MTRACGSVKLRAEYLSNPLFSYPICFKVSLPKTSLVHTYSSRRIGASLERKTKLSLGHHLSTNHTFLQWLSPARSFLGGCISGVDDLWIIPGRQLKWPGVYHHGSTDECCDHRHSRSHRRHHATVHPPIGGGSMREARTHNVLGALILASCCRTGHHRGPVTMVHQQLPDRDRHVLFFRTTCLAQCRNHSIFLGQENDQNGDRYGLSG